MRLFIAVDLDDAARTAIAEEQRRLKSALAGSSVKWVRPEQMHVTLVFIGEVAESHAPAVIDAVAQPVRRPPFDLVFGGLGVFPARGAPNVLWLGAVRGAAESVDLQAALAARVTALGVALERRPFHPHLTFGRWKTSRSADRRVVLDADRGRDVARVHVDHATLYQSRLSSAGPTYTPLARATLTR